MKDFFDLWVLLRDQTLQRAEVQQAIEATFTRRQTALPEALPVGLGDAFADDGAKQLQWRAFLRRNRLDALELAAVLLEIRTRLKAWGFQRPQPRYRATDRVRVAALGRIFNRVAVRRREGGLRHPLGLFCEVRQCVALERGQALGQGAVVGALQDRHARDELAVRGVHRGVAQQVAVVPGHRRCRRVGTGYRRVCWFHGSQVQGFLGRSSLNIFTVSV